MPRPPIPPGPDPGSDRWTRRDAKRRRKMPVHGKGLRHILNGILKRGLTK